MKPAKKWRKSAVRPSSTATLAPHELLQQSRSSVPLLPRATEVVAVVMVAGFGDRALQPSPGYGLQQQQQQ